MSISSIKTKIRRVVANSPFIKKLYKGLARIKNSFYRLLSDETVVRRNYKENTGRALNLDNPVRFNDKIIWLQLHDRRPIYTTLSDKIAVKSFVSDTIGPEYVVPLYGVWRDARDIPFDELPDEYVLKCNHDCGSVFIKRKGRVLTTKEKAMLIRRFNRALKRNYFYVSRVWGYKNIEPRVFAEALIPTDDGKAPKDYKILSFHGKPRFAYVQSDLFESPRLDFYDPEWNRIPVQQVHPNSNFEIPKPANWELMLRLAESLSTDLPHARVDFYQDADDNVLFGEMTFCNYSGNEPFHPDEYDFIFGEYLDLSAIKH